MVRDRRRVWRTLAVVVAVLMVPLTSLWLLQRRIVFQPDSADPGPAARALPGARDVVLHTADGLGLGAWYLPAAAGCGRTVLVAPGNAGHRANRAVLAERLGERGFGVLLLDYRGYGGNPGTPDEAGLQADAVAARDFLRAEVPDHQIVYFGESLGGAVLAALAETEPPAALVLRSPFTALADAAAARFPWLPVRWMLWDRLAVLEPVSRLSVPVTVIYGERDAVIPTEQSRAVAAAASSGTEVMVPGADHNDAELVHGPSVIDAVVAAAGRCAG